LNWYSHKKKTIFKWFVLPWIVAFFVIAISINLLNVSGEGLKPFVSLSEVSPDELYELDVKRSISEGVSKDENMPLFSDMKSDTGILLIHGFTGTPYEMQNLSSFLNEKGYSTYSVRLPGSGTNIENMNRFEYKDWYDSLKYGYFALKNSCENVYIVGQSLGGLLASVTGYYNDVKGIALLNPAIRIKDWKFRFVPVVQLFKNEYRKEDFDESRKDYYYDAWPVKGMYQLYLLQKYIINNIYEYNSHLLLVQAKNDDTVDYRGVLRYFEKLDAISKKRILISDEDVSHVLTLDDNPKRGFVFEAISNWIRETNNAQ